MRGQKRQLYGYLKPWKPGRMSAKKYVKHFKGAKFMQSDGEQNLDIPAGYTYLGQFIAHELSFDKRILTNVTSYDFQSSIVRTPKFDLDSIYGGGPIVSPIYYDQSKYEGRTHFKVDNVTINNNGTDTCIYDLPRFIQEGSEVELPIIPDGRNDENLILSQLHLAIILFHNAFIDKELSKLKPLLDRIKKLDQEGLIEEQFQYFTHGQTPKIFKNFNKIISKKKRLIEKVERLVSQAEEESNERILYKLKVRLFELYDLLFIETRQQVIWHFQWIVLFDYLPKILGRKIFNKILHVSSGKGKDRSYSVCLGLFSKGVFISPEFSVAAFRFGHSMVVDEYFFDVQSGSISLFKAKAPNKKPQNFYVDWSLFFHPKSLNLSRLIDLRIQKSMIAFLPVPFGSSNIVFRNLKRSVEERLPSGQDIARMMGEKALGKKHLQKRMYKELISRFPMFKGKKTKRLFDDFCNDSPFWFYILMEAGIEAKGKHLGPVGGRIVGETIVGLIKKDETSFINMQPNWTPIFYDNLKKNAVNGDNSMMHLLEFAGIFKGAFVFEVPKPCKEEE